VPLAPDRTGSDQAALRPPAYTLIGMLLDQHIDECMLTAWSGYTGDRLVSIGAHGTPFVAAT
jgi:hypothetical protein